MKKLFTLGVSALAVFAMASCGGNSDTNKPDDGPKPDEGGVEVAYATKEANGWYSNNKLSKNVNLNVAVVDGVYRITNSSPSAFLGLDGVSYQSGDLLPNWKYMQQRLNITFTDKGTGDSRDTNWSTHLNSSFVDADLINGTTSNINKEGTNGNILNLMNYVNLENPDASQLPNISKFLSMNKVLAKTLMNNDALYYAPYFDGFAEPEHFFHMNQTMVKNILDSTDGAGSSASVSGKINVNAYNNYTRNVNVQITVKDGNSYSAETITKKTNGNNAITAIKAAADGKGVISALKTHLRTVYADQLANGTYSKLSDIFLSESAAYDTDELNALMYAIHFNEALAQGVAEGSQTAISLFVARKLEKNKPNQRSLNLLQGLGIMYGARGCMESKCNAAVYLDKNGNIQDGRASDEFINIFDYSKSLYSDGIIANNYETLNGQGLIKTNQAFMIHDYMNNSTNNANTGIKDGDNLVGNVDFQAVLPPVNYWDDGVSETDYFHFSESNRSGAKTESWCIPARVAQDQDKLNAALALIDYLYSIEGDMLMNYGPNAEQVRAYGGAIENAYCTSTKTTSASSLRLCDIEHYTMSEGALSAMNNTNTDANVTRSQSTGAGWNKWSKGETGANLPVGFVREFFAEYETMSVPGKAGYEKVNAAFAVTKTYKTLQLDPKAFYGVSEGYDFFTAVPSIPLNANESDVATTLTAVTNIFSAENTNSNPPSYVKYGWGSNDNLTKEGYKQIVASDLTSENGLISLYQSAYNRIK